MPQEPHTLRRWAASGYCYAHMQHPVVRCSDGRVLKRYIIFCSADSAIRRAGGFPRALSRVGTAHTREGAQQSLLLETGAEQLLPVCAAAPPTSPATCRFFSSGVRVRHASSRAWRLLWAARFFAALLSYALSSRSRISSVGSSRFSKCSLSTAPSFRAVPGGSSMDRAALTETTVSMRNSPVRDTASMFGRRAGNGTALSSNPQIRAVSQTQNRAVSSPQPTEIQKQIRPFMFQFLSE